MTVQNKALCTARIN